MNIQDDEIEWEKESGQLVHCVETIDGFSGNAIQDYCKN